MVSEEFDSPILDLSCIVWHYPLPDVVGAADVKCRKSIESVCG